MRHSRDGLILVAFAILLLSGCGGENNGAKSGARGAAQNAVAEAFGEIILEAGAVRIGDMTRKRVMSVVVLDAPSNIPHPADRYVVAYYWSPEGTFRSKSPPLQVEIARGEKKILWFESGEGIKVHFGAMVVDPNPTPGHAAPKFETRFGGIVTSGLEKHLQYYWAGSLPLEKGQTTTYEACVAVAATATIWVDANGVCIMENQIASAFRSQKEKGGNR